MHELNDSNRKYYINKIKNYLNVYLLEGRPSLNSEEIIHFFGLEKDELNILKSAHFLMSSEIRNLFKNLPYLFRNLSHSTINNEVEYKGIIQGNIYWNKTIKTRYSRGFNDKSLFVCSLPYKHYDLGENQILKFIFKKIIFLYENILRFNNFKYDSIDLDRLSQNSEKWYDLVEEIYFLSKFYINNIYFREVSDLKFISVESLKKAYYHRNPLYHQVAKVYELYEKLFIIDDMEILKELVQNQLIITSNNDTLFEIYILFKLISKLEEKSVNNSFKLHLYFKQHKTNKQVSAILDSGIIINIFYQHVPSVFKSNSKYVIMNEKQKYGINVNVRRPDIIFELIKNENIYYRIIEIKNASKYDYMRDSFYKMFGYIHDFSRVNFTKNMPFVLVNWNGTKINEKFKKEIFSKNLIFLNKNEFFENIDLFFEL